MPPLERRYYVLLDWIKRIEGAKGVMARMEKIVQEKEGEMEIEFS
jgi:hypothetical protein